jgi:uncharacterized protein (UPF0147 family)
LIRLVADKDCFNDNHSSRKVRQNIAMIDFLLETSGTLPSVSSNEFLAILEIIAGDGNKKWRSDIGKTDDKWYRFFKKYYVQERGFGLRFDAHNLEVVEKALRLAADRGDDEVINNLVSMRNAYEKQREADIAAAAVKTAEELAREKREQEVRAALR